MNHVNYRLIISVAVILFLFPGIVFAQKSKGAGRDFIQRAEYDRQKIIDRVLQMKTQEWLNEYESMTPTERHKFMLKNSTEYRVLHRHGGLGEEFGLNGAQRSKAKRALFAGVMTGQFHESYLTQVSARREPSAVWRALMTYLIARAPKEPIGHHVRTEPRCSNWWRTICTDVSISPEMLCMFENWPTYKFAHEQEVAWVSFIKKETDRLKVPLRRPGVRKQLIPVPLPGTLPCSEILHKTAL